MFRSRKLSKWRNSHQFVTLLLFFSALFFSARYICKSNYGTLYNHNKQNNTICVDTNLILTFPPIDGLLMKPDILPKKWEIYDDQLQNNKNDRIFFHETSGKNKLSLVQCCAVESAAKYNPGRPVQVFLRPSKFCSVDPASKVSTSFHNPVWLEILSNYSNVSVILLNEEHYFVGTELEVWYNRGEWRNSRFEIAHLSDYIRILTLKKGGGMYLDMDMLTLKPYNGDVFHNFFVYGSTRNDHISNGVMHLEQGHWLSNEIIHLLSSEYYPDSYTYHGPDAIGEALKRVCMSVFRKKTNNCAISLLPDDYFYPVPSIFSNILFQKNNKTTKVTDIQSEYFSRINQSFGIHLWNSLSKFHTPISIQSNQIAAILARQNCPLTAARAFDFKSL